MTLMAAQDRTSLEAQLMCQLILLLSEKRDALQNACCKLMSKSRNGRLYFALDPVALRVLPCGTAHNPYVIGGFSHTENQYQQQQKAGYRVLFLLPKHLSTCVCCCASQQPQAAGLHGVCHRPFCPQQLVRELYFQNSF
jgi:hypothetical protein